MRLCWETSLRSFISSAGQNAGPVAFLVPQNEGAETDGQYGRLLRTKLDEEGFEKVDIVSPFLEDVLCADEKNFHAVILSLLAGDIIWSAPQKSREKHLGVIVALIRKEQLDLEHLKLIAQAIAEEPDGESFGKTVLAVGELSILFDELLNSRTFRGLENKGNRVVYSPFSEAMVDDVERLRRSKQK